MRTSPNVSMRVHLARGLSVAVLSTLGFCAFPHAAHAQQTDSVPVLGDVPLISRLFQKMPVTKTPLLGDLPLIGNLFVTRQHTAPVPAVAPAAKPLLINLESKSATFGQVIELLMDQAHLSYTLDETLETQRIGSVKLRKVPFENALQTILKMAHGRATYRLENGIYRILPKEELDAENAPSAAPEAPPPNVQVVPANPAQPGEAEKRVSIIVTDASLYQALKTLLTQERLNFSLDPSLRNYRVTVNLRNQPLRVVLEALLKASNQPLTYKIENGVYSIVPKAETAPEAPKP